MALKDSNHVHIFLYTDMYVYVCIHIYRVLTFSGINWEHQETMVQKIERETSRINAGQVQTHFWQNSRIRNRVFDKQNRRATFECGCLNVSVVGIHYYILYLRACSR